MKKLIVDITVSINPSVKLRAAAGPVQAQMVFHGASLKAEQVHLAMVIK